MGKNLHYSIRPFIEKALRNNFAVDSIEPITLDDYFAYRIIRKNRMSDLIVVLSDDYYFGEASLHDKPEILKNGGFFLIARPEATGFEGNIPNEKLSMGKIGRLLRSIGKEDYWNYEPPKKERKK